MLSKDQRQRLVELARMTAGNAYCRYSKFPVAAALMTNNGHMFAGVNVENSSFGLTNCGERSAVFAAVTNGSLGKTGQYLVAVVLYTKTKHPLSPCGACRQVMMEFSRRDTLMISICDGDEVVEETMEEVLPRAFADWEDEIEKG